MWVCVFRAHTYIRVTYEIHPQYTHSVHFSPAHASISNNFEIPHCAPVSTALRVFHKSVCGLLNHIWGE